MPSYEIGHAGLLGALHLLQPGVDVPTSEQLATSFLGRAYTKSMKVLTVTLAGKIVTLVTDGWTDNNG
ncbi:hypothetical protein PF010_g26175 [Phytophthora fragariae]|uniref:DUF659 domain-containing protein n=1 Tax=Phytophthora fragariae TaxID=53985 RepID=A0A6A4BPN2_9STRA|nr:hypothetical protein PF003_g37040 [Phytophthora fragariae]KAE8922392.1 hypothetical protein PF009_g27348 [Phytophthora fragariae]KAE9070675.1 hypothetical protein PF010_g26175 [Phytophthora fragariae]KAE9071190.1 hypothetical protein PF007_g26653 [Phytophthora fragariae]KAE9086172.1 hypothetical protein PF006_g26085 [Phytophthora fragariae]